MLMFNLELNSIPLEKPLSYQLLRAVECFSSEASNSASVCVCECVCAPACGTFVMDRFNEMCSELFILSLTPRRSPSLCLLPFPQQLLYPVLISHCLPNEKV